ncbi:transposase [Candidatus Binatia bacterium]|nr:transposase [Candidatus Binatia bacterium]
MLSTKAGKEAYVEPVLTLGARASGPQEEAGGTPAVPGYRFTVKVGKPKDPESAKIGTTAGKRSAFKCLISGVPITYDHIRSEGKSGRMGARLMAIVAEGERGRVYLSPTPEHVATAQKVKPEWKPDMPLPDNTRDFKTPNYGLTTFGDLFTPRQLVALTTFSDLVQEARERVQRDALGARASGPHSPTGWHSRGYHPHFDQPGLVQSITFRLHDSVPASLLQQWREELGILNTPPAGDEQLAKLRDHIDKYEDAGHGACHLRQTEIATIVEEGLCHFDGERYRLLEWCIMPNHVHVLVETVPGHALGDVVQSWKSFTAKKANQILGRTGKFWMADYYDRFVRDEKHLTAVRQYIRENPVKAGLCNRAEEWPFGSAWGGERAGGPRTQGSPAPDGTPSWPPSSKPASPSAAPGRCAPSSATA